MGASAFVRLELGRDAAEPPALEGEGRSSRWDVTTEHLRSRTGLLTIDWTVEDGRDWGRAKSFKILSATDGMVGSAISESCTIGCSTSVMLINVDITGGSLPGPIG